MHCPTPMAEISSSHTFRRDRECLSEVWWLTVTAESVRRRSVASLCGTLVRNTEGINIFRKPSFR